MDHYSCECHETCAYCTKLFTLSQLRPDPYGWGEFVCAECRRISYKEALYS
jgi:hypothetical protein